jgi:hypothetical protein
VAAQNEQSIETGNSGHTRKRIKTKQKHKKPTQCALDTTIRKQTQITLIRYEPSYKQLKVKTNQPSVVCGIHNTEPKTSRRIIREHKALQR